MTQVPLSAQPKPFIIVKIPYPAIHRIKEITIWFEEIRSFIGMNNPLFTEWSYGGVGIFRFSDDALAVLVKLRFG